MFAQYALNRAWHHFMTRFFLSTHIETYTLRMVTINSVESQIQLPILSQDLPQDWRAGFRTC